MPVVTKHYPILRARVRWWSHCNSYTYLYPESKEGLADRSDKQLVKTSLLRRNKPG